MNAIAEHLGTLVSFFAGLVTGGTIASLVTIRIQSRKVLTGERIVDQTKAKAGGDIVGGNKTTRS